MATFRYKNKRYAAFFSVFLQLAHLPPQNSITITEEKYHRIVTQQAAIDKVQKGLSQS